MKIIRSQNSCLRLSFIILMIYAVLPAADAGAWFDSLDNTCGGEFADPAVQYDMPEDWKQMPVKYDPSAADADVVVTFDQQLYLAWMPIVKKYAGENNIKIITGQGTCGLSAGRLMQKSVDIGAFCCPPCLTDRLPGLKFHTAGIAAIALIVHPDNPVDNITLEQARKIFSGELYRWSELKTTGGGKGPNMLIKPVGRLHCKLRPGHWRTLLANEDIFSPSLLEVGTIPDMISQIAMNPGAIGYEIMWMTRYYQNKGKVKVLKLDGYDPDDSSRLASNMYPLYRVYSFTTWEGNSVANPHAEKLVESLLKGAEQLDSKFGLVPSSILRKAGWKFRNSELIGKPAR